MKRELVEGLAYAGFMLVLSAGAVVGHKLGYIDHDTVTRIVMTPIGLWMVWYGNRIPKTFVRNAQARGVQRVSGWSQVLRGHYQGVGHRSHLDRRFWISVDLDSDVPPGEVRRLVDQSYDLVCAGLTRKQKAELAELA